MSEGRGGVEYWFAIHFDAIFLEIHDPIVCDVGAGVDCGFLEAIAFQCSFRNFYDEHCGAWMVDARVVAVVAGDNGYVWFQFSEAVELKRTLATDGEVIKVWTKSVG
jgi:hypothetical protein